MNQPTEETKDELAELQQKCEEYLAGWKRAQADYQNLQKEHSEQMKRIAEFGVVGLVEELLPVLDHYDLAIKHVPEDKIKAEWMQGFFHIDRKSVV